MGFISDLLAGNNHWFDEQGRAIKKNPERLLLGAMTPVGTKVWNEVLGKDWKPTHDAWGGPSAQVYKSGEEKGIDMGPAHNSHRVARVVTSMGMAGGAAAGGEGPAGVQTASQTGNVVQGAGGAGAGAGGWTRFLGLMPRGQGAQRPPEIVKPTEIETPAVAPPEDFQSILARYNANEGAMADGRRIQVSGDTATLLDENGRVIGRAPNNRALYDALASMETNRG